MAFTIMCMQLMHTSSRTSVSSDFPSYASFLCPVGSHLPVQMDRCDTLFISFCLLPAARQNLDNAGFHSVRHKVW